MSKDWIRACKRFWNAEEVPRWFGLSLVTVYLLSLGTAAHLGIKEARRQAGIQHRASTDYALCLLADRLGALRALYGVQGGAPPEDALQHGLRGFASRMPVRHLRVVDSERRVAASTEAGEVGTTLSEPLPPLVPGNGFEAGDVRLGGVEARHRFVRVPLRPAPTVKPLAPAGQESAPPDRGEDAPVRTEPPTPGGRALFIEAIYPADPPRATGLANHAGTLATVLVACGIMFALYHWLRKQMRVASQIVERLQSSHSSVAQDLASLRLSDAASAAGETWNQLIELATDLQAEVSRTQANTELARAFERAGGGALAEALHAVADGIIHVTAEGRFDYMNTTARRLLGWGEDQVKEATIAEATAPGLGNDILETIRAALRPDGTVEPNSAVLEPEGTEGVYRVWVKPLQGSRHRGSCIVVVRDVSQQVRADRVREEFVTQVTHELRTPLSNIRAYAETLSSGMFDDPKVVTECYNVITKETRRLSRLVEDVLSVSQMEVGSIELQIDTVDLRGLLSDGVRDVRGLADDKNIDLQLVLPTKMEAIRGDRDKLAIVLNNVLGNAIKYTLANGSVVVGCQTASDQVSITVKDNGIGVDPADHARIFEKFQRAEDPDVQNETGSGIGLYTAREIVRRHGGDIELVSNKGEGSTFIIRLPHTGSRAQALSLSAEA